MPRFSINLLVGTITCNEVNRTIREANEGIIISKDDPYS